MMGLLDKLAGSESLEGLHEVEEAIDEIPSTADRDQARRYLAQLLTLRQKLVIEGLARFLSQPGPEGAKAEPGTAAGIASTVVGTATTGRRTMKPEVAKRRRAQTAYKRALVKDYGFPKKYETAYLAFRSEHLKPIRDQHAMAHPGEPPSMKSVYEDVAYRWKSLTPEERAHWDAIGDENKREHQRKVQEWVEAHPDVPLKVPEQDVDAWEAVENEKRAKKGVQEEEEEEEGEE